MEYKSFASQRHPSLKITKPTKSAAYVNATSDRVLYQLYNISFSKAYRIRVMVQTKLAA